MKAKRWISFLLCFCTIVFCACDAALVEESRMDAELSFLEKHTVFKTSIDAVFENGSDADLLLKRLGILGIEVVDTATEGECITYTVLSHFPFTKNTADALMMKSGAQIMEEDGTAILITKEVLDVTCDIVNLSLYVPQSFAEKEYFGKMVIVVDGNEHIIWTTTRNEGSKCYLECSLDETNVAVLHTLAIAMYPGNYKGNVSIEISKACERVTDKMQG